MVYKACAALLILGLLSACGVDGAPERPTQAERTPIGLSVSGTAEFGVSGSF